MMRGDVWSLSVCFVLVAFLGGILSTDASASGLTAELGSLFGTFGGILAITAFVATMAAAIAFMFGNPLGGGGF